MRATPYIAAPALLGFSLASSVHRHGHPEFHNKCHDALLKRNTPPLLQNSTGECTTYWTTFYGEPTRISSHFWTNNFSDFSLIPRSDPTGGAEYHNYQFLNRRPDNDTSNNQLPSSSHYHIISNTYRQRLYTYTQTRPSCSSPSTKSRQTSTSGSTPTTSSWASQETHRQISNLRCLILNWFLRLPMVHDLLPLHLLRQLQIDLRHNHRRHFYSLQRLLRHPHLQHRLQRPRHRRIRGLFPLPQPYPRRLHLRLRHLSRPASDPRNSLLGRRQRRTMASCRNGCRRQRGGF